MIIARSILFNALFYANLITLMIVALPTLLMPGRATIEMAKLWGRTSLWLLRVVCGTKVEFRGVEKLPQGPLIVAAKHQSTWETFALLSLFDYPVFIIKRELLWVPLFGWLAWKADMIEVDRGSGSQALLDMTMRARKVIRGGRQLMIFPEGTRRAAGAEPRYKYGVAHLYDVVGVPCVPVALNSGQFWRRRSFLRLPGTIVVEFLDPIAPGLDKQLFFERLQSDIESATARLIVEGERELSRGAATADQQPV